MCFLADCLKFCQKFVNLCNRTSVTFYKASTVIIMFYWVRHLPCLLLHVDTVCTNPIIVSKARERQRVRERDGEGEKTNISTTALSLYFVFVSAASLTTTPAKKIKRLWQHAIYVIPWWTAKTEIESTGHVGTAL